MRQMMFLEIFENIIDLKKLLIKSHCFILCINVILRFFWKKDQSLELVFSVTLIFFYR